MHTVAEQHITTDTDEHDAAAQTAVPEAVEVKPAAPEGVEVEHQTLGRKTESFSTSAKTSPKACANPIIVPDKVPGNAKGTT